jgi:hypothetical protein
MEYLKIICYSALTLACIVYIFTMLDEGPEDYFFQLNSQINDLKADVACINHTLLKMGK